MSTPDYPNREHRNADEAARRRALKALDNIVSEVTTLRQKIEAGRVFGGDTQIIASLVRDLTDHAAVLEVLRDVREWHAADLAEREAAQAAEVDAAMRAHASRPLRREELT